MMLYAVLADIHGNYQALEAVEADALRFCSGGKLRFICLGDVVDYGPQPNECIDWLRDRADSVVALVQGNHDRVAMQAYDHHVIYSGIDCEYWPITLWTWHKLGAVHRAWLQEKAKLSFILKGRLALFHGTPHSDSVSIDTAKSAREVMDRLPNGMRYGLFGHTHTQGYYLKTHDGADLYLTGGHQIETQSWISAALDEWIPLPDGFGRALVNPGSVGQPRHPAAFMGAGIEHDWRAAYMLLSLNGGPPRVRFRRVEYDVDKTVYLLRRIPQATEPMGRTAADIIRDDGPLPAANPLVKRYHQVRDDAELLATLVDKLVKTLSPRHANLTK